MSEPEEAEVKRSYYAPKRDGAKVENPFLFRTSKRAGGEEAVQAEANAEDEEDELRRLASLLKI